MSTLDYSVSLTLNKIFLKKKTKEKKRSKIKKIGLFIPFLESKNNDDEQRYHCVDNKENQRNRTMAFKCTVGLLIELF